jgi:hypothetical protein
MKLCLASVSYTTQNYSQMIAPILPLRICEDRAPIPSSTLFWMAGKCGTKIAEYLAHLVTRTPKKFENHGFAVDRPVNLPLPNRLFKLYVAP